LIAAATRHVNLQTTNDDNEKFRISLRGEKRISQTSSH